TGIRPTKPCRWGRIGVDHGGSGGGGRAVGGCRGVGVPVGVLFLFMLGGGPAAPPQLPTRMGPPRGGPVHPRPGLPAGRGVCCLWPQAIFLDGLVSWGNALWIWAIGGAFLVAFGGFAYLVGSFLIGLFSKVPEDSSESESFIDAGRR